MKTITMKFAPGKPVEVTVTGVAGQACREFSKPFEDALGLRAVSSSPTDEAMLPEATVGETAKLTN